MPSWSNFVQNFIPSSSPQLSRTLLRPSNSGSSLSTLGQTRGDKHPGTGYGIALPLKRVVSGGHSTFRNRISSQTSLWSIGTFGAEVDFNRIIEHFFEVITSGDVIEIESLLASAPELLNAKTTNGWTALHLATSLKNVAMIDCIAQHGADMNARDVNGNTALHLAVSNNDAKAIKALLAFKSDPKIKNTNVDSAVHVAVRNDFIPALQALLESSGTDVNASGQNGETPLHIAAGLNEVDCVDLLVRHRASVCKPSLNGSGAMHAAASHGAINVLSYLLTEGSCAYTKDELLSVTDDEQATPLHAAVYAGNKDTVKILLDNGASLRAQMQDLSTPLHLACSQGAVEIVEMICNSCDAVTFKDVICLKDEHGMTPLHRVAVFNHWKLVWYLLDKGAPIDERDANGNTPLVLAASRSSNETVSALLEMAADVSIANNEGRNFMHFVVLTGGDQEAFHGELQNDQIFSKLLNEKDKHGCTPLHYAAQSGFGKCSENLLRLGASLDAKNSESRSALHFAAAYGRYNTVKMLIQTMSKINAINDSDRLGYTPLHLAAENGHTKVMQLLLASGAIIHKTVRGYTPLHAAVVNDHREAARVLVDSYAYLVKIVDKEGNTALHTAAANNSFRCVIYLLDIGAVLLRNNSGLLPIDVVIASKHHEVAMGMMQHDRWEEILMQPSTVFGWPLLGLVKDFPNVTRKVLDRCRTTASCHPLSKDYFVQYDFRILEPGHDSTVYISPGTSDLKGQKPWKTKPLEVLNCMIDNDRSELISHPVCKQYLDSKWRSYGIYIHFSNLLIYTAFLTMLTFLILRGVELDLKPHMMELSTGRALKFNATNITVKNNSSYFGPVKLVFAVDESLPELSAVFLYVVMIFTGCHLLKKILQIHVQGYRYFLRLINYFELTLYISALIFAFSFFDIDDKYIPWQSQWLLGAVAGFFAWCNLMMHVQRYGKPGIYVGIFLREMRMVLKAFSVYFIMICAFSMAFCVLNPQKIFPDDPVFYMADHTGDDASDYQTAHATLETSLLRVTDMLVGDVDAIFNYIDPILNGMMIFPNATYFLALCTVGVITLLIQAILMGTAVYDLDKMERSTTNSILAMQIALHTEFEGKLPKRFIARFAKREIQFYPNHTKWRALRKWINFVTKGDLDELGTGNTKGHSQRGEDFEPNSDTADQLNQDFSGQDVKLKDLNGKMDKHHELLRLIVQRMEIKLEADLVDDPTSAQRRISRYAIRNTRPKTMWKNLQTAQNLKSALKRQSVGQRKSTTVQF